MEPSTPAKPEQLHNFDLPKLKWIMSGNSSSSNYYHRRRPMKSLSRRPSMLSASPIRQSLSCDSVSAPLRRHSSPIRGESPKQSPILDEAHHQFRGHPSPETEASRKGKGTPIVYRRNHSLNSVSSSIMICSSGKAKENLEEKPKVPEEDDVAGIKKTRILIKIPRINNAKPEGEKNQQNMPPPSLPPKIVVGNNGEHGKLTNEIIHSLQDEEKKVWNLRPRKPKRKSKNAIFDFEKTEKALSPLKKSKGGEKEKKEKNEKKKLSICISLSQEEIDDDIYALTGSKPSRRPKKRTKNVQKNLDSVFPGLLLVSISPDSYKVSESSMKG